MHYLMVVAGVPSAHHVQGLTAVHRQRIAADRCAAREEAEELSGRVSCRLVLELLQPSQGS